MSTPGSERRRHPRAPVSLIGTVEAEDGDMAAVVVLSLSASGAMVQTDEAPKDHGHYQLQFTVHQRPYDVPVQVVGSLHEKDVWGWRCRFVDVSPEQVQALARAVEAAIGQSTHSVGDWNELRSEAAAQPEAPIVVGQTAAGRDISVVGKDLIDMGADGLELYVKMMAELERM